MGAERWEGSRPGRPSDGSIGLDVSIRDHFDLSIEHNIYVSYTWTSSEPSGEIGELLGLPGVGSKRSSSRGVPEHGVTVFTVGYGALSRDDLLDLLKQYGIELVADIRRWPTSKLRDFQQRYLGKWLRDAGIRYAWMGRGLGGRRGGGYRNHAKDRKFTRGVDHLAELGNKYRTCLLCVESSPRRCHRRFIADMLEEKGLSVYHIVPGNQMVAHRMLW